MARRFARLRPGTVPESEDYSVVPSDGLCLNVFLIVRSPIDPSRILLGRLDPTAPWRDLAGLGPDRVGRIGDRWMLPASQLLILEGPDDGARRLARELLGLELTELPRPRVLSETYGREGTPTADPHWDLHYVYDLPGPSARPPTARPWSELEYVDIARTPRARFGRGHADVLELLGFAPAP